MWVVTHGAGVSAILDNSMMRFFLGLVLGVLLVVVSVGCYLMRGTLPVATADKPFPFERQITGVALHARIHREMVNTPPVAASPDTFDVGAQIYLQNCAACHGVVGKNSGFAKTMYPRAPQLLVKHRDDDVVGVSDDPPGETYWKVANGIRLSGMPAYKTILSETQMWQVAQLLANADKLPADVTEQLKQPVAQP
jgi:thiosulfate dehydrogenase